MGGTNRLAAATFAGLAACPTAGAFTNLWLTLLSMTTGDGPGPSEISARVSGLGDTVFDCDTELGIFTSGGGGMIASASAFDCANLALALVSRVFLFIAGDQVTQSNLNLIPLSLLVPPSVIL